jgi:hypothetical protein
MVAPPSPRAATIAGPNLDHDDLAAGIVTKRDPA